MRVRARVVSELGALIDHINYLDDGSWDNPRIRGRVHLRGVQKRLWPLCMEYQAMAKGWTAEMLAKDPDQLPWPEHWGRVYVPQFEDNVGKPASCRWCLEARHA